MTAKYLLLVINKTLTMHRAQTYNLFQIQNIIVAVFKSGKNLIKNRQLRKFARNYFGKIKGRKQKFYFRSGDSTAHIFVCLRIYFKFIFNLE